MRHSGTGAPHRMSAPLVPLAATTQAVPLAQEMADTEVSPEGTED